MFLETNIICGYVNCNYKMPCSNLKINLLRILKTYKKVSKFVLYLSQISK